MLTGGADRELADVEMDRDLYACTLARRDNPMLIEPGNPFPLADMWLQTMKEVNEPYKLEAEVTQLALQALGVTQEKLRDALWHARCEWDV